MMKQHFLVLGIVSLFVPACSTGKSAVQTPDGGAGIGTGIDADTAPTPGDEGYARVATALTIGQTNACAIVSGSVYCWGGIGVNAKLTPVRVDSLKTPATAISGGDGKNCAIVKGSLYCWTDTTQLPAVSGLPSPVTAISVGFNYDCAIAAGQAYFWGKNNKNVFLHRTTAGSTPPEL
jgi:serine/threonine-protein kinase